MGSSSAAFLSLAGFLSLAILPPCPALGSDSPSLRHIAAPIAGPAKLAAIGLPEMPDSTARRTAKEAALSPADEKKARALTEYFIALSHEEQGELDLYMKHALRVLDLDPGFVELANRMAYEYARRGDTSQAIGILKDAVKSSPKHPLPYLSLASLYFRNLKKPDLALKYANQALALAPEDFTSYQILYDLHLNLGQKDSAEKVLQQAHKIGGEDPQFWLRLAELYRRLLVTGDNIIAEENLPKLNEIYENALKFARSDPDVLTSVADFYLQTAQTGKAVPLYLKAVQHSPSPGSPLLTKLARSLQMLEQRDEAIRLLEEMIWADPLRAETHDFLGQLHEEASQPEKALASYQQAIRLDPERWITYLRMADIHLRRLQQPEQAIEVLREAQKRFPGMPYITSSLAITYSQAGRHEESLEVFEQTLKEAEQMEDEVLNGGFFFAYGAAAERAGSYLKAVAMFKRSIELDPASAAPAYNYLGYMWVQQGKNLDEAAEMIRKALELDPANPAYMDSLGWLYYKQGQYEKALVELLRAAENMPPDEAEIHVIYDHIGSTYQKLGNISQAIFYWGKALQSSPDNEEIQAKIENAREHLANMPRQQE